MEVQQLQIQLIILIQHWEMQKILAIYTVKQETSAGTSSSTRGVFVVDYTTKQVNIIDYVTIIIGNAVDFGDINDN
jgi:hypothetical protein